jgi:hypothetical protein
VLIVRITIPHAVVRRTIPHVATCGVGILNVFSVL